MNVNLFNRIRFYITEHKRNRRWLMIVTVLAVAVLLLTAYILGTPAHTMEGKTYCGFEEHKAHSSEEGCYEIKNVMDFENPEDGDEEPVCAEREVLVCKKEIHTHTLQCYSNPDADTEDETVWLQSVRSAKLGDDTGENVLSIARTQLGYRESEENYLANDGDTVRGYSRYGDFTGDKYCDWGIAFCQFCVKYAGVPGDCFENAVRSDRWIKAVEKSGFYRNTEYIPKTGDIVFLTDKNEVKNKAGVIEKVYKNSKGNIEKLDIIEGNFENSVCQRTVNSAEGSIYAYCEIPSVRKTEDGKIITVDPDASGNGSSLFAAGETNVTSLNNLNNGKYCLTRDITISSTVSYSSKNITINLNGHKVTSNVNPAFRINGGNVTFYDSVTPTVSSSKVTNAHYGTTASYNNGKLTYYVTETSVIDDQNGATQETLREYVVSGGGMIIGKNNGRAFEVSGGGVLNLNGGYICSFKNNDGGAVYISQNNSTVNLNGTVIAANSSNRGGAVYMNGYTTLNINGGIISGNTADGDGGGGVYARRESWDGAGNNAYATINLQDGFITNNYSSNGDYWAGGGGVQLEYMSKLVMTGGYITANKANGGGGGVKTRQDWGGNQSGRVEIYGGFITANNALGAEGGGLNINAGGSMYMEGGYITNNVAGTGINDSSFQHWGGGGMFCSENSASIVILNSIVTENSAGGFGGGVAGCSTGRIKTADDSGTGIFENYASGSHTSGGESTKNEDHYYAAENEVFMSHGYQDYFCALASNISGAMLGGGAEKWEGTSDGVPVSTDSANDIIQGSSVTGLTSYATDNDKDKARAAAQSYFNGNISPTHGGGILANGYLVMGNVDKFEVYSRLEIDGIRKKLCDETGKELTLQAGAFEIVITDEYGEEVARGVNASDGTVDLDRRIPFTSSGNFIFYIYEKTPETGGIQCDTSVYKMEVTVYESRDSLEDGDSSPNTVPWTDIPCYYYYFSVVKVTRVSDNAVIYNGDPGNSEAHAVQISPLGNNAFVNRVISSSAGQETDNPDMYISVKKAWQSQGSHPASVIVNLLKDGDIQETVTLNSGNDWKYQWKVTDTQATYSVTENPVTGYVPDYEYSYTYDTTLTESDGDNGALLYKLNNGYYVPVSSGDQLDLNGQYIIASPDGKYLLAITPEHADAFLTSADKAPVARDGALNRYKADSSIPDNCIFVCKSLNRDGYQYRYLENQGVNSFPLLQINSSTGKALKGTNSNWYSSPFRISSGHIQGQLCPDSWQSGNQWRYIIWDGSSFDSDTKLSKIKYEQISASHKNYVITNIPEALADYTLVIKTSEKDNTDRVLAGAVFEIKEEGTPLKFTKVSEGCYRYSENGDITQLTTSTKGSVRILDMKDGDYTVTQISPPDGYTKAGDTEISLNSETPNRLLELQVENAPYVFTLPETGGPGTVFFYLSGSGLILCAIIITGVRRRYRRKEAD